MGISKYAKYLIDYGVNVRTIFEITGVDETTVYARERQVLTAHLGLIWGKPLIEVEQDNTYVGAASYLLISCFDAEKIRPPDHLSTGDRFLLADTDSSIVVQHDYILTEETEFSQRSRGWRSVNLYDPGDGIWYGRSFRYERQIPTQEPITYPGEIRGNPYEYFGGWYIDFFRYYTHSERIASRQVDYGTGQLLYRSTPFGVSFFRFDGEPNPPIDIDPYLPVIGGLSTGDIDKYPYPGDGFDSILGNPLIANYYTNYSESWPYSLYIINYRLTYAGGDRDECGVRRRRVRIPSPKAGGGIPILPSLCYLVLLGYFSKITIDNNQKE